MTQEEWQIEVGARFRETRLARGLSEKDVADEIGCTPQLVSSMEKGKSQVVGWKLRSLCMLFGEGSDYFLFGYRTKPILELPTAGEDDGGADTNEAGAAPAPSMLNEIFGRAGAADPVGR